MTGDIERLTLIQEQVIKLRLAQRLCRDTRKHRHRGRRFGRRLVGVHAVRLQPNSRLTALPCLRPSGGANVVLAASLDLLRGDGEQYRLALGAE